MLKTGVNVRRIGAFLFSKSLAPAWVVLAALLVLTYGEAYTLKRQTAYHIDNFLSLQTDEIARGLETRFRRHESFMEMIAGLLLSSEEVTAEEWQTFISHMDIETMAPEAAALGYVRHTGEAYRVVYGGLASAHDSRLENFDFAKAPVYRALIEKALHTGKVVAGIPDHELSERMGLAPDEGALLVLERAPKGEDGFVFGIFSLRKTLEIMMDEDLLERARLQVYSDGKLFFDSSVEAGDVGDLPKRDSIFSRSYIGERFPWTLRVSPTQEFDESNFREEIPVWISIFGTMLSISFFTIIVMALYISKQSQDRLSFDLHDREKRLEAFLRRVPVSIVMLDQKSDIIAHSDRFSEAIVGHQGASLVGQHYFDVLPDIRMNNAKRHEHIAAALKGEEIEVGRAEYTREDGETVFVMYRIHPWRGPDGSVQGAIIFIENITESVKSSEKLKRTNLELEQFAYIASHDLKAPLRGIDNLAKWIEEDIGEQLPTDAREKLGLLRGRVHRLEMLLEGILKYSRAGRIVEKSQEVDVSILLQQVAETVAEGKGHRIVVDGKMPVINTLRTPLEQIFTNLVGNAIKHSDKGTGTVRIGVRDVGSFYEFSVSDDGPGIPQEFHERVFGMFQTLQSRDKKEGSGMGMAIVKKLVEWQGGKVWVAANENGAAGADIHFLWPKISKEKGIEDAA